VIGAGSGGRAFAAYLSSKGHSVSLYNRSYSRIHAIKQKGGIQTIGSLEGFFPIDLITQDLRLAVEDTDVVMVVIPASAHKNLAKKLASILTMNQIVILNPGRTFGSVEFKRIIDSKGKYFVKVGETQTLLFTSRQLTENKVNIIKIKDSVNFSTFPEQYTQQVYDMLKDIFPQFNAVNNYLEVTLANIGMLLHPAISLLNAGMMDIGKRFKFYKEGASSKVCKILENIESELNEIFKKLDIKYLRYIRWAKKSYGVETTSIFDALQKIQAYENIYAPNKLITRYLTEDVPTGLVPISSLAEFLNIQTPTIDSIIHLSSILCGQNFKKKGRTLKKLKFFNFLINYLRETRLRQDEERGYYPIKEIVSNPNDFKICSHCNCLNSNNNKYCWVCHLKDFRKIDNFDLIELRKNGLKSLIRT
jgi:opine dehydrogenase